MTHFHQNPLTCDTALEQLEALSFERPPNEPLDSERQAAWEHVQDRPSCVARMEQRRESDKRIASLMQTVAIPIGLKERLLAQSLSNSLPIKVEPVERPRAANPIALRKRAWLLTFSAVLLVVVSSGLSLWLAQKPSGVSLQVLYDQTPLNPMGLTEVRERSAMPTLPAHWTRQNGLRTSNLFWFSPNSGMTSMTWVSFELPISKKTKVRGVLLVVPKSEVISPPPEWIASAPRVIYTKRGADPVAVTSWCERGVVYVCLVPGDATQLERLLLHVAPIAT